MAGKSMTRAQFVRIFYPDFEDDQLLLEDLMVQEDYDHKINGTPWEEIARWKVAGFKHEIEERMLENADLRKKLEARK